MTLHFTLLLLLSVAAKVALVFLCMLLHEAGHLLACARFDIPVHHLGLNWMGMYLRRRRGNGWHELITCLAGPGMNLLVALLFWHTNYWFALCNLTFGWVNLLPIPYSDGSNALRSFR